jgi:hypothetical protein
MKMNPRTADLYVSHIARAKKRGMRYYAKSNCCIAIHFGVTMEGPKRKAERDARRMAHAWGFDLPDVESGELS